MTTSRNLAVVRRVDDEVPCSARHAVGRAARHVVGACVLAISFGCGQGEAEAVVAPNDPQVEADDDASQLGAELLGTVPPDFEVDAWLVDGVVAEQPITLQSLRGSVVLVRLWTDTCPFCKASAPALVELHDELASRGLVVIGIHHPKPRPTADERDRAPVEEVAAAARAWGMRFPIGLDRTWRTVDSWWLAAGGRSATSASFLLDRSGVIRWVHPGPEFHPGGPADHEQCRADYAALRAAIEAALG